MKKLSNTRQIRAERQTAERESKKLQIITGEKTHVSNKFRNTDIEIERRKDLEPR